MPEQIIIENDIARIIDMRVVREVRLEDLLPHVEHRPAVTAGPLPKTALFHYWDESNPARKTAKFLCELAPQTRRLIYNTRAYMVAVPWTYFLYSFNTANHPDGVWTPSDHQIFWAREPVQTSQSLLYRAMVPNCNDRGGICYGNTGVPATLPLGTRVDRTVENFYRTQFTHDSGAGVPWYTETRDYTFARWHTESIDDPLAWQRFPEWEGNTLNPRTVATALATEHIRTDPILVAGIIPPIPQPFTFGRAEEWLNSIGFGETPEDKARNRHRLQIALQNMVLDDPAAIVEPQAPRRRAGANNDPGVELTAAELREIRRDW